VEFESFGKSPKSDPVLAILEWVDKANDLKKRGLYVDFEGEKWVDPRSVSAKDFALGYALAKVMIGGFSASIRKIQKSNFQADEELKAFVRNAIGKKRESTEEVIHDLFLAAVSPFIGKP
jgi:hypothetical protein